MPQGPGPQLRGAAGALNDLEEVAVVEEDAPVLEEARVGEPAAQHAVGLEELREGDLTRRRVEGQGSQQLQGSQGVTLVLAQGEAAKQRERHQDEDDPDRHQQGTQGEPGGPRGQVPGGAGHGGLVGGGHAATSEPRPHSATRIIGSGRRVVMLMVGVWDFESVSLPVLFGGRRGAPSLDTGASEAIQRALGALPRDGPDAMSPAPRSTDLPAPLQAAAREVAASLKAAGRQAWIVGGAVRDLALGRVPKDVDLATDARPEEVEAAFARTSAVGKAFGTILVHLQLPGGGGSVDVEVTTFRSDGEYLDARRPEEVHYGETPEEDARRRDFTCNALYLDPLDGRLLDPTGGLEDLARGRLRCVGEASERFREDGLRLLRLVRFEARFDLEPTDETLAAARGAREALRGVSPERVRAELVGMLDGAAPARAMRRLADLGLLELALPGIEGLDRGDPARRELRLGGLARAGTGLGAVLGLALLLGPDPGLEGRDEEGARRLAESLVEGLRPSRAERRGILALWDGAERLLQLLGADAPRRSERLRLVRAAHWPDLLRLARAALEGSGRQSELERLEALADEARVTPETELFPRPLLDAAALGRAGVPRGPLWGELLEEAESLQLDGELTDEASALRWLATRL